MSTTQELETQTLDASFSTLVMSVASSALMSLGLSPDPTTGKTEPDKQVARFNIDLLVVLKEKTKNNLNHDEQDLLTHILQDLQLKFMQMK